MIYNNDMLDTMDILIQRFNNTPEICHKELITYLVEQESIPNEFVFLAYKCSQVFICYTKSDQQEEVK